MAPFDKIQTEDGSITYFHPDYREFYHSLVGAKVEARRKFLEPSNLLFLPHVNLLDIGFGLGYNALGAWFSHPRIHIVSLEKDEQILEDLDEVHKDVHILELLQLLKSEGSVTEGEKSLQILFGDARNHARTLLASKNTFDIVFLDAFSPPTNPELWSLEFLGHLFQLLNEGGRLLTYSSALSVISALRRVGFKVYHTQAVGRTRGGLIAFKLSNTTMDFSGFQPISDRDEYYLAHSVRSIPNIDKSHWNIQKIKEYRKGLCEIAIRLNFYLPHKHVEKLWKQKEEKDG